MHGRCVGVKRRHVSGSDQETGQPIVCGVCVIGVDGRSRCSERRHQWQAGDQREQRVQWRD
jgi:hypothetical protein